MRAMRSDSLEMTPKNCFSVSSGRLPARIQQGLGIRADVGQRRAQLVRHIGHELAPRVVQPALLG